MTISIIGTVTKILRKNPHSDHRIINLTTDDGHTIISEGPLAPANIDQRIEIRGRYTYQGTLQRFIVHECRPIATDPVQEAIADLNDGSLAGVTKPAIRKIIKSLGPQAETIIESDENVVDAVLTKTERIAFHHAWPSRYATKNIRQALHNCGISSLVMRRIHNNLGDDALARISVNPWLLYSDVPGIGLTIADQVSKQLPSGSIVAPAHQRTSAIINKIFILDSLNGHTAIPEDIFISTIKSHSAEPTPDIINTVQININNRQIEKIEIDGLHCLQSRANADDEIHTLRHLNRLNKPKFSETAVLQAIAEACNRTSTLLLEAQHKALVTSLTNGLSAITGGPGTGKTKIASILIEARRILDRTEPFHICAPTARAAQRVQESTGQKSRTIHRLLRYSPRDKIYGANELEPLPAGLTLVDEMPMVDANLNRHLLAAQPDNSQIVYIGDINQLQPVGPGQPFDDILSSKKFAATKLTEIRRQSLDSDIVYAAHAIENKHEPVLYPEDSDADLWFIPCQSNTAILEKIVEYSTTKSNKMGYDPIRDVIVLSPQNATNVGTHQINRILQPIFNKNGRQTEISIHGIPLRLQDQVMQTTINHYAENEEHDVYNGDIGTVDRIDTDPEDGTPLIEVRFKNTTRIYNADDMWQLQHAYSATIHKAQGSQAPLVLVVISESHTASLNWRSIFTAMTRAERHCIFIGNRQLFDRTLKNRHSDIRITGLKSRLMLAA